MSSVVKLEDDIYQIDVYDMGAPGRTSSYLIVAEKTAIIETGPSPGTGRILAALQELGVSPEKIDYIIVTHIHLDHSGGAGVLAQALPSASVLVHPRGARHLIDPSRLIAGARPIYGDRFEKYFGEILPVPAERVHTPDDGETLDLGGGRMLTFYHTQGHARHHYIIHDPASRGVFSGDALGVHFEALSKLLGYEFTLPSTSPSEFDLQATVATLERMQELALENIYFAHFGQAGGAPAILSRNMRLVIAFEAASRRVFEMGGGPREVEDALWELVMEELSQHGLADREHPAVKLLELDMELNAQGIVIALEKEKKV